MEPSNTQGKKKSYLRDIGERKKGGRNCPGPKQEEPSSSSSKEKKKREYVPEKRATSNGKKKKARKNPPNLKRNPLGTEKHLYS